MGSYGFYCRHHRRVTPLPAHPTCYRHPCDMPSRLVMGLLQDLDHLPCHHLALTAIKYRKLIHRLIHHPPGLHCCYHLRQHPHYNPPLPLWFPQVLIYCWPIAVFIGDCTSEVREGLWQWQVLWIDLEQDPTCIKSVLYGLLSELQLHSLLAVLSCVVLGVDLPLWYLAPAALTLGEGVQVFL